MLDNALIKRCLAHGIQIFPIFQNGVLRQYETKTMPDDVLNRLSRDDLASYVRALELSSMEMAGDWTRGHKMLVELGFKKVKREEGHRVFVSLVYGSEYE